MRALFIFIAALFALSSCSKNKGEDAGPAPLAVRAMDNIESAQAALIAFNLRCAQDASCPESTGILLAADSAGGFLPNSPSLAGCTAALVGEDLALTNSHCVPLAVKLRPELCRERVRLVLPKSGARAQESFACAELLGASARETPTSPDLALLRLERKTTRAALPLKRGVAIDSAFTMISVTPDLANLRGELSVQRCQSAPNSYRMPLYRHWQTPLFVLGDCASVPGNSGSPVLNSDSQLVGLSQAALPLSEKLRSAMLARVDGGKIAPLTLGTSLICLKQNPPAWDWNPDCGTITDRDVALAKPGSDELFDSFSGARENALHTILEQNSYLGLASTPTEATALSRTENVEPRCWKMRLANEALPLVVELRLPKVRFEAQFNRYLQPRAPRFFVDDVNTLTYLVDSSPGGMAKVKPLRGDGPEYTIPSCLSLGLGE